MVSEPLTPGALSPVSLPSSRGLTSLMEAQWVCTWFESLLSHPPFLRPFP